MLHLFSRRHEARRYRGGAGMTTCFRCGQTYSTKPHGIPDDCIQSLIRRNARDRQVLTELTTAVSGLANEMSRMSQRVEMLAVQSQGRDAGNHASGAKKRATALSKR